MTHRQACTRSCCAFPAKDLCRLRAVCRPWRSLLSDPNFIAAHAAFHTDPFFVVVSYGTGRCYDSDGDDDRVLFSIMDLSGRVIKRQLRHAADDDERVMCATELGLICVSIKGSRTRCRLINPATGAVHELPQELAAAHGWTSWITRHRSRSGWSHRQGSARNSVAIDGVVYFLLLSDGWDRNPDLGLVASFDLETEEWSAILGYRQWRTSSSSAASDFIDLWFLMDFEKGLWVKQHSIEISDLPGHRLVQPLLVLNDGRILLYHIGYHGCFLLIFDPGSKNCTNVLKIDHLHDVCLYPGLDKPNYPGGGRSLTYDRAFIAAHRACCHPEPLLAYPHRDRNRAHSVDIVDLSGQLVRREHLHAWHSPRASRTGSQVVLANGSHGAEPGHWCWCVTLPECQSEYTGNGPDQRFSPCGAVCIWSGLHQGRVQGITCCSPVDPEDKVCEVSTIDADGSNHGMWCINLHPLSALNML
ncbi:hypothetical protein HU200_015929 [Digitaria exilis]|uniref:F-box domain-containing protein n=1 Tax=Digitaria exilis TaxID=1010633 RepID=A0A835F8W2_9POAL|nr:hypothetical protein HU200_015929 [Digitaria exilis]